MISKATVLFVMVLFNTTAGASQLCWTQASYRYDIPIIVLKAVAYVESRQNPHAIRTNKNGSTDYGLMQINTRWLPYLKRYGINTKLVRVPCLNIMVGAWILKREIIRYGFNWKAIGAYHAGAYTNRTMKLKLYRYAKYSEKVYRYIKNSNLDE